MLPNSRRWPRSAATESPSRRTRNRLPFRTPSAAVSASAADSAVGPATLAGRRSRRLGVRGGGWRSARAYTWMRGTMQPTSDTVSSRYTAANQGEP